MTAALRVGLVGCGRIGQSVHLNVLRRMPGVELMALAEADPVQRAAAHRLVPDAVAVADYADLLRRADIDAVDVCLPTGLHAAAAVAVLEHRKHLYLEKPIGTTVQEGQSVVTAWERIGTTVMVGFNLRFHPLYQAAQQHVRAGTVGTPLAVRSVLSTAGQLLPAWKHARQSGGGVLLDLASHHFDLLSFLFEQRVSDVFATLRSLRSEADCAAVQCRLTGGVIAQSFFSLTTVDEDRFEIYGDRGTLTIDRRRGLTVDLSDGSRRHTRGRSVLQRWLAPHRDPSYAAALAHFVTAARTAQPVRPDCRDGYRSLVVVAAAEESARTGRAVALPEHRDASPVG